MSPEQDGIRQWRAGMGRLSAELGRRARRQGPVLFVLIGAVPARGRAQQTTPTSLVFDKVTVVDVAQGKLVPDQQVVITGNRILSVRKTGTVPLPPNAEVVPASGKYLIPGLWDMHAHLSGDGSRHRYALTVAHGITGIREMASSWPAGFDSIRDQRRAIAEGVLAGPRIVTTSYDFYSPVCKPEGIEKLKQGLQQRFGEQIVSMLPTDSMGCLVMNTNIVRTPDQARHLVRVLKAGGVDFLKLHAVSDRDVFFAILAEARRLGMPAAGHLGGFEQAVTEIEASDSGLRSVEHIDDVTCWQTGWHSGEWLPDSLAETRCAAVAQSFLRNGTWFVPTLYSHYSGNALQYDTHRDAYKRAVGLLHRLGVPLLAGSDADTEHPALESPLHMELALLVEAGLTPVEALQAATLNPAKFFGAMDSLGTLEPGKVADAVLLDANPLADIRNIETIRAVVANGRYFDRTALDHLLAD